MVLDDSYSRRNKSFDKSGFNESEPSFIDDNFYESKSASIFDDDFQGIEWPVKQRPSDPANDFSFSGTTCNLYTSICK